MVKFEYHEPTALPEAVALLAHHGDAARLLAGGTAALVDMKHRSHTPLAPDKPDRCARPRPNSAQWRLDHRGPDHTERRGGTRCISRRCNNRIGGGDLCAGWASDPQHGHRWWQHLSCLARRRHGAAAVVSGRDAATGGPGGQAANAVGWIPPRPNRTAIQSTDVLTEIHFPRCCTIWMRHRARRLRGQRRTFLPTTANDKESIC